MFSLEQAKGLRGDELGGRSALYSLGVVIVSLWPETPVFGHTGAALENGRKTGLPQDKITRGFWPRQRESVI